MLALQSCAYNFQNSSNPLAEKEKIRKVYIAAVENNTFKPGIENLVYNMVQESLVSHQKLIVVDKPDDADGFLQGTVTQATSITNAVTQARALEGAQALGLTLETNTASEYLATLGVSFQLVRRNPAPGQKRVVWTGGFARSRPFQAQNRIGTLGSTSPLINESEADRILSDLARRVAEDVHESMLGVF